MFALKRLATDGEVKKVRCTVVDNFQGEENDIILLSFVRSNSKREVGFLKVSNRICVALSRAKKGLYCIGNFTLLEEKSHVWRNIIQTLNANKSIGTSLKLVCQNHPDRFVDVSKSTDFKAVPEGGCGRKCEYRLHCGHSCTRFCHPDDIDHEKFQCQKPCMAVCEQGHLCPRICYQNCHPCPTNVEKTLSKCGHTIIAWCGLSEDAIQCREPCEKTCEAGHPCPKKCYSTCGSCKVIVDKLLSRCNHTVKAECGKSENEIKCQEPCKKSCKEGHPCPKMCFKDCGDCEVIVDKILSRCKHTVKAECGKKEFLIRCEEACNKACAKGHPCPKKCFRVCGPCEITVEKALPKCGHVVNALCSEPESQIVCNNKCTKTCSKGHTCQKLCHEKCGSCNLIVDTTLNSCGHTVKAPCCKPESEINCTSQCKKTLPCSHQCKNICCEPCTLKCLELTEIQLPNCGHSLRVKCYRSKNLSDLHKKCLQPCEDILPCGHICNGTCGACLQGTRHVLCKSACQKMLSCGHKCVKKCNETCVENCMKIMQIQSPVCGHLVNIECHISNESSKLSMKCVKPCRTVLPCGHTCKGTCGSCYQGRLHIACNEVCNRTLICGHKCASKCCKSCPPCEKPCENRCAHGKCPRKCGYPCLNCTKPCAWICSHKKCTRQCYEVCDRDPCNERCSKQLPCNHQCIGFCGEPCPKECVVCDRYILNENLTALKNRAMAGYVYLEDCKHSFKEDFLGDWFTSSASEIQRVCMKTCPKCKTVVCRNWRFNKVIKNAVRNIEKIKLITKWDKAKNIDIQRNLLEQANVLHFNLNILYKQGLKLLSGGRVRNIHELTSIENTLRIAKEIESKSYSICSMFKSSSFHEALVNYTRYCREWMADFISINFLVVSEYQLQQLSREVLRLHLLDFLLKYAELHHFASLSPDFKSASLGLMTFAPFTDECVECFKKSIENFVRNLKDVHLKYDQPLNVTSMSGSWYQCLEGHTICLSKFNETAITTCYKCKEYTKDSKSSTMRSSNTSLDNKNNLMLDSGTSFKDSRRMNELDCSTNKTEIHGSNLQSPAADYQILLTDENATDLSSRYPLSFMKYSNKYRQASTSHQAEKERKSTLPNWKNDEYDSETNFRKNNNRFRNKSRFPYQEHSETAVAKHIPSTKRNISSRGIGMPRQSVASSRPVTSGCDVTDHRRFRQAAVSQISGSSPRKSSVSESEDKRVPGQSSRHSVRGRQAKSAELRRKSGESNDASKQSSSNVVLQQDSKKNAEDILHGGNQNEFPPKRHKGRGKRYRKK